MNEVISNLRPILLMGLYAGFWYYIFKLEKPKWITVFLWNFLLSLEVALAFKSLTLEKPGGELEAFYDFAYNVFLIFSIITLVWAIILLIKKMK